MTGRLFAVVGPSGVGKDTLLAGAVARDPSLHWVRRIITRPETAGGEPFSGTDLPSFQTRSRAGHFALEWQAHGLHYGIPHAEFLPLGEGRTVLFNGSRAELPAAQMAFPDLTVIRVTAPSRVLAERLAARGRETLDEIEARLRRASDEVPEGLTVIDVVNDASPEIGIARLLAALQPVSA
jgi:ribose 1,5-bisphosphokinase